MKPDEAITLLNWFPTPTDCVLRGGYASHATGMTGTCKTLAVYNKLTGTSQMFGITGSGVYNVTSAGAVGASLAARTEAQHQQVTFGDGTNNYLILVNGVDKPLYYDGTSWIAVDNATSPALTGLTTTSISGVNSFKGRLFFIEKNSLAFWYLAAGAAGGALTKFDLSGEARKGGYLVAMGTWTLDAGDGLDDKAVFVTSEGEVIIYAGTNPSSASTWAKIGSYELPPPLGKRCLFKYGGDLGIITQAGVFGLSSALQAAVINNKLAITDLISNEFTKEARSQGSMFGWEGIIYPAQDALIINIPVAENSTSEQYVMNTITKKWCEFDTWNAQCFGILNEELYFARGTAVYKAWTGTSDDGSNIIAIGKTAFNYFGKFSQLKHFRMFRPMFQTNGSLSFLARINVDFKDDEIFGIPQQQNIGGSRWGIAHWGIGRWSGGLQTIRTWDGVITDVGYCAASKIKISTNAIEAHWIANDIVFETGGIL